MQVPTPTTFPVHGVTTRNAPVAHRVTECLDHLHSYAAALVDNAMEDGQPVPDDLIEAWRFQIHRIQEAITTAGRTPLHIVK